MDDFQRRSRLFQTLSTVAFAVLVLAMLAETVAVARSGAVASAVGVTLVYRTPMPFYLWAIWTVRVAFAELARGAVFDLVIPLRLTRLGIAISLGGFVSVFISPNLLHLLYGPRWSGFANFDPAAITLGVVGLMLVMLARLFAQAVAMRTELDEFL